MGRIATSRGDPDKVATAAWAVSGEHFETGDHAIFSVDNPARIATGHTRNIQVPVEAWKVQEYIGLP